MRSRSAAVFLSRFVPTGMRLPVLRGPLRGAKWICGAASGDGKGLSAVFNMLEPEQLDVAAQLTGPDSVCLDIGANVGLYTLLFARYGQHVYAFEPVPRNVRYLARLVEINRLDNATIVPAAVAARCDMTRFDPGMNNAVGRMSAEGPQPIATLSCDKFIEVMEIAPTVVKIDVEGAEIAVLDGARRMLTEHRPVLLLSVHSEYLREKCMAILHDLGYRFVVPLAALMPTGSDALGESEFAIAVDRRPLRGVTWQALDPGSVAATAAE